MKILISGGSGLIGTGLSEALVSGGHQVWVLTRHPQDVRLPKGVQPVGWDGKTTEGWVDQVRQMDAIVNLAGENIGARPWTNERKRLIRSSRVDAGRVIVEAITAAGSQKPKVLLQSSAIGYYGTDEHQTMTEESPHGSDYLSGVAMDWEASTQPVEALGVRRVIARTGVVLSKEGGVLSRFLFPFRLYAGGPMGSGRQWLSWIHLQDEVDALRFLLENETLSGPVNLTAPEPVTNAQFGQTLAELIGRPFWLPAPGFALKAILGEMSTLVLDGQRVLPEKLLAAGFQFKFPQLKMALEDLLR